MSDLPESAEGTVTVASILDGLLPLEVGRIRNPQTTLPRLAKDPRVTSALERAVQQVPTRHVLRAQAFLEAPEPPPESVQLVLTAPPAPAWGASPALTERECYEEHLLKLEAVWRRALEALEPGGRLICVVTDPVLSRRRNRGTHKVEPLHASIQEQCRRVGFDNLAPIIVTGARAPGGTDAETRKILGKPYEPNAVIEDGVGYILMQRKPGGYRNASLAARLLSLIPERRHRIWFRQVWPLKDWRAHPQRPVGMDDRIAERLVRMFSFAGDVVLDPFLRNGSVAVAAASWGRSSIGYEGDVRLHELALDRVSTATDNLFSAAQVDGA